MKFGKYLAYAASQKPEYSEYFLNYKQLKTHIKRIKLAQFIENDKRYHHSRKDGIRRKTRAFSKAITEEERKYLLSNQTDLPQEATVSRYDSTTHGTEITPSPSSKALRYANIGTVNQEIIMFHTMIREQLQRIDEFFQRAIIEYSHAIERLTTELEAASGAFLNRVTVMPALLKKVVQYYRGLEFLRNFAALNKLAVRKCLKKYFKVVANSHKYDDVMAPKTFTKARFPRFNDTAAAAAASSSGAVALPTASDQYHHVVTVSLDDGSEYPSHYIGSAEDEDEAEAEKIDLEQIYATVDNPAEDFFCHTGLLEQLMEKNENLYALYFAKGDRSTALHDLRSSLTSFSHSDLFILAFGLGLSVPITIMLLIILFVLHPANKNVVGFFKIFIIFRGTGLSILFTWLWGLNLYLWTRNRINHIYLFGLRPSKNLTWIQMLKLAAIFTVVWLLAFVLYIGAEKDRFYLLPVASKWFPLALLVVLVVILVFPFPAFHRSWRFAILSIIGHLLITPFGRVGFLEVFAADQLTSMVVAFDDLQYIICFYATGTWNNLANDKCTGINLYAGPIISSIPFLWRFTQCIKRGFAQHHRLEFVNAGKYATALMVILFSALQENLYKDDPHRWTPYKIAWVVCAVISSLFGFLWDIMMDWGLVQGISWARVQSLFSSVWLRVRYIGNPYTALPAAATTTSISTKGLKNGFFLRSVLLFRWKWVYYVAMLTDLLARFSWYATISETFIDLLGEGHAYFLFLFAAIELLRRAQWNIFRLEYEMVSNYSQFRSTNLPVPLLETIARNGDNVNSSSTTTTTTTTTGINNSDQAESQPQPQPQQQQQQHKREWSNSTTTSSSPATATITGRRGSSSSNNNNNNKG